MAVKLNDSKLLTKLESPQSVAYHSTCNGNVRNTQSQDIGTKTVIFISQHSVQWRKLLRKIALCISLICYLNINHCSRISNNINHCTRKRAENLENKIIKAFGDRVT